MGSNESTANTAAVGAALGALVYWVIGLLVPADAMAGMPDEALIVVVTWLFCRFVPSRTSIAAQIGGTAVLGTLLGLTTAGCSLSGQDVVNGCTTAGMVYRPVQVLIEGTVTEPKVPQDLKEKLGVADAQAVMALRQCLRAAEAKNDAGVTDSVAGVAAATSQVLGLLAEEVGK